MFVYIPRPGADRPCDALRVITRLPGVLCLILLAGAAVAQEPYTFRASVDRDSITVGDPFVLNLSLELPENASPAVIPDIGLPETFRVLGAPEATREPAGVGRVRWVQSIRLTTFRPGEVSITDLRLRIVPEAGDTVVVSDDPISILVQSVKPDSLNDIVDVKAPVPIEAVVPMWVWPLLGGVIAAVLVGYFYWRRKRGERQEAAAPVVVVDWFGEVRRLITSGLIQKGAFDAYYTRLSEALRRYIEQRTGVDAMERTTYEIRGDLTDVGMAETRILEVEGFLTEADLVKFAKFEPDVRRAGDDGEKVLALMTAIEREHSGGQAEGAASV